MFLTVDIMLLAFAACWRLLLGKEEASRHITPREGTGLWVYAGAFFAQGLFPRHNLVGALACCPFLLTGIWEMFAQT